MMGLVGTRGVRPRLYACSCEDHTLWLSIAPGDSHEPVGINNSHS